jgi:hypothetical protein
MMSLKKRQNLQKANIRMASKTSMEPTMIEITFQEFHEQKYEEQLFRLYVMKNGLGDILYIGITINDIWERWFGWGGHVLWDGKLIYGDSPIGVKIENHLPDSLSWKIQLWTLEDCIEFCQRELPSDSSGVTIHAVEPIMIRKLSPALNATYNLTPGKDTTPKNWRERELEQRAAAAYREIFDKKR